MNEYTFWQVDAFSRIPYKGNAAAVIFDADELTTEQMQTVARQFNLSETVFLCAAGGDDADYTARIFTPRSELPFAGHPTIAVSYSFLVSDEARRASRPAGVRQRCGVGVVPIDVSWSGELPHLRIRSAVSERRDPGLDRAACAQMLGCAEDHIDPSPAEVCSIGIPWLIVSTCSLEAIQSLTPDQAMIARVCNDCGAVGVSVYAREAVAADADLHVRSFAPDEGVAEDPVCGSGNGAVGLHYAAHHAPPGAQHSCVAEQGLEIGRDGRVHIDIERDGNHPRSTRIGLGGEAVRVMEGRLWI